MSTVMRSPNLYQQAQQLYYLQQVLQEAKIHAGNFPDLFLDNKAYLHYQEIDNHLLAITKQLHENGIFTTWPSAHKMGMGTAQSYDSSETINPSRVWFSLVAGGISEIMYPSTDEIATKSISFIVTDGSTFVHHVPEDCVSTIRLSNKRALAFEMTSVAPDGCYQLIQEVVVDPEQNSLLISVKLVAQKADASYYRLYLRWEPYLGEEAWLNQSCYIEQLRKYVAIVLNQKHAVVLRTEPRWIDCMLSTPGEQSGLDSLRQRFALHKSNENSRIGRVEFTFELQRAEYSTIMLEFQPAFKIAMASFIESLPYTVDTSPNPRGDPKVLRLAEIFTTSKRAYIAGWNSYCNRLNDFHGQATDFYYLSAMLVKAHMDKTHRGAVIASLSMPWGPSRLDIADLNGYRMVWVRDLYHAAMSLLMAGDRTAADHILEFMSSKLQLSNGSFPQTANTKGIPIWRGIQLDQIAAPILLAWWMEAVDKYESMVKPAAEFLIEQGPATPMERWEENSGFSPATLAAEVAALICAADLAEKTNNVRDAERFQATADKWQKKIDTWCFTTNGLWRQRKYYLRISPSGDPNVDDPIRITNGGGWFDQRLIVDPSFLELVRLGIKQPSHPYIVTTLAVVDEVIRRATAKGVCWYRYNNDGYGEKEPGTKAPGQGHLWPLLSGERGIYEVARGDLLRARELLADLERLANCGGMLSEQVWEGSGNATGSATPLVWAHAEYIMLLKSIVSGEVADRPSIVWRRYAAKDEPNASA